MRCIIMIFLLSISIIIVSHANVDMEKGVVRGSSCIVRYGGRIESINFFTLCHSSSSSSGGGPYLDLMRLI